MKALEELTADIRQKLPRLRENKEIVLDDGSFGILFAGLTDLMLNDVMEYLGIKAVEFAFTHNGFYAYDNELEVWGDFIPINTQSSYLKDQYPELINFLHGLIKH